MPPTRTRIASHHLASLSLAISVALSAGVGAVAATYDHVLVLSIDGLHEADLMDPNLTVDLPNITALRNSGITFTNAYTPVPTDSFPGVLSEFTGASPRTTGIYYDHAYSRSLFAPGATLSSLPGTQLNSTGDLDWNSTLLGGGDSTGLTDGSFGTASINSSLLPQKNAGGTLQLVYPHELLQVNTVFDVAHAAGLRTAYIDKHPAYDLVRGPNGTGLDDFYAAESDAKVKIEGVGTNAHLVDAFTTTTGTSGLGKISNSTALGNAYDDFRLKALMNEIDGKTSSGGAVPGNTVPAIFGMNFVALGNAQRLAAGGIDPINGPSADVHLALSHIDGDIGAVISELQAQGLYNDTLIVLTAKHGNSPRVGTATRLATSTFTSALAGAGISVATVQQDDSVLIWLTDQTQTAQAKQTLQGMTGVDTVYAGSSELVAAGFGDPSKDDRTPDIMIKLLPGYIVTDSSKRAEHGGFSDDDSHVALILSSGGVPVSLQGSTESDSVSTTEIAVTTLEALGLDPAQLQGAVAENTQALPGTGIPTPEPAAGLLTIVASAGLLSLRPGSCRTTRNFRPSR